MHPLIRYSYVCSIFENKKNNKNVYSVYNIAEFKNGISLLILNEAYEFFFRLPDFIRDFCIIVQWIKQRHERKILYK